jgi:hypothetical protein
LIEKKEIGLGVFKVLRFDYFVFTLKANNNKGMSCDVYAFGQI